jgi:hypothetical protein
MQQHFVADRGQKGGAMFTTEQLIIRPLECAWKFSGDGLICVWMQRAAAEAAGNRKQEEEQDRSRRVA